MENAMEMNDAVKGKIEDYVKQNKVVLFLKGTPQQPMCGFSAKTVAALDSVVPDYVAVNVLDDSEIREGIKQFEHGEGVKLDVAEGRLRSKHGFLFQFKLTGSFCLSFGLLLSFLSSGCFHFLLFSQQRPSYFFRLTNLSKSSLLFFFCQPSSFFY